jgi:chromosome segregation ATPase
LYAYSSIFNFKQLSSYGQALKTTSTDVGELSKLTSLLTTEQAINALSSKGLTDQQVVQILMNKGIVQSEAEAIASKMASTTANGVATFSLKAYTAALWANIKAIGVWMLTNPVGWIIGLGVAFVGTTAILDGFTETIDEQKEKINELKDEYSILKDELESLDNQTKENIKTINKLQEKADSGTITLVEEDQLRKLKLQNELLEQQYKTKEELKKQKKKELVTENRETFNNEFQGSVEESASINFDIGDFYTPGISSYKQAPNKNLILLAKVNAERLENALLSGDENLIELLQADKTLITDELSKRSDAILFELLEYQNNLAEVMNADGTFDDTSDKNMWDAIESWKKEIYAQTNRSGEWNTIQINTVLDDTSLMKSKNELKEKFTNGDLTEADIKKYDDLISSLEDANLVLENGQSVASVYLQYLNGIAVSQNNVNSSIPSFSFSENKDSIDDFQSQISDLSSTLAKVAGGSITSGELVDLYEMFPQLSNKTSDLSEALRELIFEKLETLKTSLKSAGASDEVLTLFDDMVTKSEGFSMDTVISQLQSSHTILKDVKKEVGSLGYVTAESLQKIISQYPQLEGVVNDYLQDKIKDGNNEKDLISSLSQEYDSDIDNYKKCIIAKRKIDTEYYKQIYNNISDDLKDKAKSYNIDLEKYKTYNEAKLELDKEYERKKSHLTALDKLRERFIQTDENGKLKLPQLNPGDMMLLPQLDNYDEYKKEVEDIQEIINELDTSIDVDIPDFNTNLFDGGSSNSGSDADKWSDEIDWAANSIANLENEIEKLNRELEDTSNYTKKLEIIEKLKKKEEALLKLRKKEKDNNKDEYNASLNKLGKSDKKKYKNLIESDTKLSVEQFGEGDEKLFNKVKAAQEAWQAYQQSLKEYKEQVKKVADTDKLEYETKQEEVQNKIDRHSNNAQDYQNVIDKKEAIYGYAAKEDYQNLYDENEKSLVDFRTKRENAKANRAKIKKKYGVNSSEYNIANDEVQDLQNEVAALVVEQTELNRTILEYPIHTLEEANEELENQLDTLQKYQSKVESALGYATTLIQDQVDLLNDNKKNVSDYWDDQIEDVQKQKDAFTESNDELQRTIDLENAKYNLEKAQRNKTQRVYRAGEGFVYKANQEDVRSAQSELDQQIYNNKIAGFDKTINGFNKQKEDAVEEIDKQIETWEEYAQKIDRVSKSYEDLVAMQDFIQVFGADAITDLLNKDENILGTFEITLNTVKGDVDKVEEKIEANSEAIKAIQAEATAYLKASQDIVTAQSNIKNIVEDNENEIKAIETRSTKTQELSGTWSTTKDNVTTALSTLTEANVLAKDAEFETLSKRILNLKTFETEATTIYGRIATLLSNAQSAMDSLKSLEQDSSIGNVMQNVGLAAGLGVLGTIIGKPLNEYHSGGIVGQETSKNKLPENLVALTDANLKPNETLAKLLNGEVILNHKQMGNIFTNLNRAYTALTPLNKRENSPTTITIGDVNVYNPDNTDMIVDEIVKELPLKVIQRLHSK